MLHSARVVKLPDKFSLAGNVVARSEIRGSGRIVGNPEVIRDLALQPDPEPTGSIPCCGRTRAA
jgi:hypothetical protein